MERPGGVCRFETLFSFFLSVLSALLFPYSRHILSHNFHHICVLFNTSLSFKCHSHSPSPPSLQSSPEASLSSTLYIKPLSVFSTLSFSFSPCPSPPSFQSSRRTLFLLPCFRAPGTQNLTKSLM